MAVKLCSYPGGAKIETGARTCYCSRSWCTSKLIDATGAELRRRCAFFNGSGFGELNVSSHVSK